MVKDDVCTWWTGERNGSSACTRVLGQTCTQKPLLPRTQKHL